MRNIFTILVIAGFSGTLYSQHFVHYANEKDQYSFKYPEDWKTADNFDGKLSFVALAPEETEAEDGVRERCNIALYDFNGKSLEIFYAQYKSSHQEKNKSWKLVSEGEMLAGNRKMLLFVCYYSDDKSKSTLGEVIYVLEHKGKAYVLTCTSSFDELDKFRPLFDKIAQSYSEELFPEE